MGINGKDPMQARYFVHGRNAGGSTLHAKVANISLHVGLLIFM